MLQRLGSEHGQEIEDYLRTHAQENILVLSDLMHPNNVDRRWDDPLSCIGYRTEEGVIAVQAFYRYGRWFPHYVDENALAPMIEDMMSRRVRWLLGVRRVVDPIIERLKSGAFVLDYDEKDYLYYTDAGMLRPHPLHGVRRATRQDVEAIAQMRFAFECEYFDTPPARINRSWCTYIAERYVERGAFVAERLGRIVSMAAVEATIPQLSQIGAVYTRREYRNMGLARGVVSGLCEEELCHKERVTLTVGVDNEPALKAYADLGFRHLDDYRMGRFG
ncbi:MAG: GNAT family N-acetyltransferase [Anaerolineales bacterium]